MGREREKERRDSSPFENVDSLAVRLTLFCFSHAPLLFFRWDRRIDRDMGRMWERRLEREGGG
eukprot:1382982-Amorphochlora_amoeboformis.AAC.1